MASVIIEYFFYADNGFEIPFMGYVKLTVEVFYKVLHGHCLLEIKDGLGLPTPTVVHDV